MTPLCIPLQTLTICSVYFEESYQESKTFFLVYIFLSKQFEINYAKDYIDFG